ncbi:MAG: EpsI family protein [Gallionellaceae bacterium]|nr:EpsI family protein [Gallionellaceae bacterium]
MNPLLRTGILLAALMFGAGAASGFLKPTKKMADQHIKLNLEKVIPAEFGDWKIDPHTPLMSVSPDVQAELDKLYNQTLSRIYVNSRGERIMLSIAYGGDQSDSLTVHMPEGCYGGQGFQIRSKSTAVIQVDGGQIPLVRMLAEKSTRSEPISYWIFIGRDFATTRFERKLAQLRSSLLGTIPEGVLVRVSNISGSLEPSYRLHEDFIKAMTSSISPEARSRIVG